MDATPSGMTERWTTSNSDWFVKAKVPSCPGGKVLEHTGFGTAQRLLSLDAVDSDVNRENCEIFALVDTASVLADNIRMVIGGSGGTSTETGYLAVLSTTSIILYSAASGSFTQIGTAPFTLVANKIYGFKFRTNGTSIQARVWDFYAESEPGTWPVSGTGTAADGWCGIGCFNNGTTNWYFVSIATNGETAAMPSISGNELRVTQQFAIVELLDPALPGNPPAPLQAKSPVNLFISC